MTEIKKTCPICGREFATVYSFQNYCSKECQITARRRRDHEKYKLKSMPKRYKKTCYFCGKEFIANRINSHYCSKECQSLAKRLYENQEQKYNRCRRKHNNCDWCEHPDCIY